jgi:glutathione S-transferase
MSAASRFIRLMLAEYDEQMTLVEQRLWERDPAFLTMNPLGTLPVLVENNRPAICSVGPVSEYLDETRGAMARERRLMPEDAFERAEVRRLIEWYLVKLEADVTRYMVRERVEKLFMSAEQGGGSPDAATIRAARANITYHMQYTEWLAGTRSWLGGDMMSAADLAAAAALSVLDYIGEVPFDQYPHMKEWYQRIKSRPAFRPLLGDRLRGLSPVPHYADLDF